MGGQFHSLLCEIINTNIAYLMYKTSMCGFIYDEIIFHTKSLTFFSTVKLLSRVFLKGSLLMNLSWRIKIDIFTHNLIIQ